MGTVRLLAVLAAVALLCGPVLAGEGAGTKATQTWLSLGRDLAAATPAAGEEPPKEGPPLPFHCIEGYSGGPITPMAYICNQAPKGAILGKPTTSYTFLSLGSKRMHVFVITLPFLERFEFGYACNWFALGSFYDDVRKAGLDAGRDHVQLHHFNLRCQILPENSFDLPLPAVTAGIHFKYNEGIKQINRKLGGALDGIGYDRHYGVDYTLTASKTLPKIAFGRPVIVTAGLRLSRASQLGLLGFGDECRATVEGSVIYLPIDRLALAYEFRRKENPYATLDNLVDKEDNWHCFSASYVLTNNLTLTGLYGRFGNIANASADCVLGVQVKYEF